MASTASPAPSAPHAPIAWDLYRTLLGVLEEGSLSGAARALGLTQPTVGRQVAALERALATPLFVRSPTGLVPTEAALALRGHAQAMASTAAALERAAASQGEGVRGVVRITASHVVGLEVLPRALPALRERHPDLAVELVLSNRVHDLLRQEADVAVRMTPPKQAALVTRHVGHIELGLHAHPDYLARHGRPRRPEDLAGHALIGFDRDTSALRSLGRTPVPLRREMFALRTDDDAAQLALLRAGAGLGVCQVSIARRDGLVRLLPKAFSWRLGTWITLHEDLRHSPRCRAAFDWLVETMTDWVRAGA